MFLASGRMGVVRMSVLRKPNILCTEFLDVAGVKAYEGRIGNESRRARTYCTLADTSNILSRLISDATFIIQAQLTLAKVFSRS